MKAYSIRLYFYALEMPFKDLFEINLAVDYKEIKWPL
jgi:hypothetical protein